MGIEASELYCIYMQQKQKDSILEMAEDGLHRIWFLGGFAAQAIHCSVFLGQSFWDMKIEVNQLYVFHQSPTWLSNNNTSKDWQI